MYGIIRQVIANGGYKLAGMQEKIKRMYVLGDLTDGQLDELMTLAAAGAAPDAERPEALAMLRTLAARMDALEARMNALEGTGGAESGAYPEWTAWDGVSENYQYGAIVSHDGRLWRSVCQGQNVWEPGAVSFWEEWQAGASEEEA